MQGDPQQTRRQLLHELADYVHRQFVRTRERPRMRLEIIDGELEPRFQLLKFDVASRQLWRVIGGLIVVTEQVIEIVLITRSCGGQKVLWQNHTRAEARSVRSMAALSDAVETIAGGDHPGIGRRSLQIAAVILEYRRVLRRQ